MTTVLATPFNSLVDVSMVEEEVPKRTSYSISEEEIDEMRLHIMELEERRFRLPQISSYLRPNHIHRHRYTYANACVCVCF